MCKGQPDWWYEIVDDLPNPIIEDGYIEVWDIPGLGIPSTFGQLKRTFKKRTAIPSPNMAPGKLKHYRFPIVPVDSRSGN